ncbi:Atu4866 domain-containing protein [Micromonospora sp. NBC_00858]|uniref:Atu4866 domain-containing protein n=1 Tax=Micromonospora sp. NBC_00858 TaxID=2975979 RepID=UPI003865BF1B|nr:Atu4866 domain-containing protein [Micromonospora sp. NBC_00858]
MSIPMLDEAVLARITANTGDRRRPLMFVNATIHTLDPAIGDLSAADLLLDGEVIVGVGPGLHTAAEDDGAIVVDCTGLTIVPAVIDGVAVAGLRARPADRVGALTPGNPATFAVVADRTSGASVLEMIVWWPEQAAAIVVDGEIALFNGRRLTPAPIEPDVRPLFEQSPYLGRWIDESGFVHQELTADGRYDETRGGRPHAYQGSFWIDGDRIVYHDDLGFWAYGLFTDGVLHHAGYVFHQQ